MAATDDTPVDPASIERFEQRVVGRRISEDTWGVYRPWIERFEMWRPSGDPDVGTLIDFDSWLADSARNDYPWESVRGRPAPDEYAHSTRNVAISALKLWVRLEYDQTIVEEPQNIVSGEPAPFDPEYLSRDDIERVIENAPTHCDNQDCRAALRLSYDAIMRASEVAQVRWEDIDLDTGMIYVRATKGSDNAKLGLESETVETLREFHRRAGDRDGPIFYNAYGRAWNKRTWARHFRRNHHEAGSHSWGRHSPIVHRLNNPGSFETMDREIDAFGQVFRRARHSNPSMTSRYARLVGSEVPDWAGD